MTAAELPRSEFQRQLDVRQAEGKQMALVATEEECRALARRFGLVRIDRLEAALDLSRTGAGVDANGRLSAEIVQTCAVSGEDLPVTIDEPLQFRFVAAQAAKAPGLELEIDVEDCDEIEFSGSVINLGEAVAQSLALAIDPFAVGPNAEAVRREAGLGDEGAAGPFAALAALKPKNL